MEFHAEPFITVDADVDLGELINLVGSIGASYIVIEASPADDESADEDQYYLFGTDDILADDFAEGLTLRESLLTQGLRPALVEGLTHASFRAVQGVLPLGSRPLDLPQQGAGDAAGTVFLDDGIVSAVVPSAASAAHASSIAGASVALASASADGESGVNEGGPPVALGVTVEYARTVVVNTTLSLLIGLSHDPTVADAIPVAAKIGDVIDVVVSPRGRFVVEGPPDGQLVVSEEEPLPIHVKLRATEIGSGRVTVYAFNGGTPLGSLTITPDVVAEGASTGERALETRGLVDVHPAAADLVLVVLEQRGPDGQPELEFRLTAKDRRLGLNLRRFGPVTLESSPGGYFDDLFSEIEEIPTDTRRLEELASERLQALGADLFTTLFPEDLRALLWGLQDEITSVLIQSDEAWVPWEICRLVGEVDGRVVEGPFFCEAFEVTRWIPGEAIVGGLSMHSVGLIIPSDSNLPHAADEAAMMHRLASDERTVVDIPPNYSAVRKVLSEATHDAIHFVGHGAFPDAANPARAEISLAGNQKLRPKDLAGEAANLRLQKPLVFFNACQAGRGGVALTGAGGWAAALVKAGVGAFVGTHWEVTDTLAAEFAEHFYKALDEGQSIGAATRVARLAIKRGDPTWLAYTVFAEPTLTLT